MKAQFHLALTCKNLEQTKLFYKDILGAQIGRTGSNWLDVDLFENQITFTKAGPFNFDFKNYKLGDNILPSFHFGVIVDVDLWGKLYSKLFGMNLEVTTQATFLENRVGEHLSFFIKDPNGYMVEIKSFKNYGEIFSV
jgi:extradiol dioxygenase family protein